MTVVTKTTCVWNISRLCGARAAWQLKPAKGWLLIFPSAEHEMYGAKITAMENTTNCKIYRIFCKEPWVGPLLCRLPHLKSSVATCHELGMSIRCCRQLPEGSSWFCLHLAYSNSMSHKWLLVAHLILFVPGHFGHNRKAITSGVTANAIPFMSHHFRCGWLGW